MVSNHQSGARKQGADERWGGALLNLALTNTRNSRVFRWRRKSSTGGLGPDLELVDENSRKAAASSKQGESKTTPDARLPASRSFNSATKPFMKVDGPPNPLLTARSAQSQSGQTQWNGCNAILSFQWKYRVVKSIDQNDFQNHEVERRIQYVIVRCAMDGNEVSPQQAYDALRPTKGVVDEAVGIIKRERSTSSSSGDNKSEEEEKRNGKKKKTVRFAL